jgi:predicted RNA-binding protein (virulence factor B family)
LRLKVFQPIGWIAWPDGQIAIDSRAAEVHRPAMAKIGERASLQILHEKSFGLFLDGGDLGEILLPHREIPRGCGIGEFLDVFLYNDSEDRPVATLKSPKVMPGRFGRLKCVAVTGVGAFLDWGLPKDLLVPFREQKVRMEVGKNYIVHVHVDEQTHRIIATTRIARHMDLTPPDFRLEQEVDLIIFGKTDLGYKAIIDGTHSGLLFANEVFQPLQPGEALKGYITAIRPDGKINVSLHPVGRAKVDDLEGRILKELEARGGFWSIGDHSPAAEINDELGVSKRTFKQATGALFKKGKISIEKNGIRLIQG